MPIWPDDAVQVLAKHGPAPEFTTYFDDHIQCGQWPFCKGQYRTLGGEIRFAENFHAKVTYPLLLALIDAWPPVSLTLLSAPATASSLTWTVEFIVDASFFLLKNGGVIWQISSLLRMVITIFKPNWQACCN